MTIDWIHPPSSRRTLLGGALVIAALAGIMGAPTLRGQFVGGDDHRLALDHALVSRPSLAHAVKLFQIQHRDLYQPLPLLTFSMEFALCDALGLRADWPWPDGGAWIFHLTNILLHALNAVSVAWLILRLDRRSWVAGVVGVIFAAHPLQMEVVAWVNGRMMLLSTLFGIAALHALVSYLQTHKPRAAVMTLGFLALSLLSKIRPGLPVLMALMPWAAAIPVGFPGQGAWRSALREIPPISRNHRDIEEASSPMKLHRGFWILIGSALAITGVFAWINVLATAESEMFSNAAEQMRGSRIARCFLTLAWYFTHVVWPAGLASWYRSPDLVTWGQPRTWGAVAIVAPVLVAIVLSARRTRVGWIGMGWFLATMASTLPIVPARNLLAADRYMYLPGVGLYWILASALFFLHQRLGTYLKSSRARKVLEGAVAAAILILWIRVDWRTATYYENAIHKTLRIAEIHPDTPRVHERLGWAYFNVEDFDNAIKHGRIELERFPEQSACEALVLIGTSWHEKGDVDRAEEALRQALAAKPDDPMARYRLANVLAQKGRDEEAAELYRQALAGLPNFNPGLIKAGNFLRRLGRIEEAVGFYEKALENNAYDIHAPAALAEIDMEAGRYERAAARLEALLRWMPEHVQARINLGVCYKEMGRLREAIQTYQTAIDYDPRAYQAMLNLAFLLWERGQTRQAETYFERALRAGDHAPAALEAFHDFHLAQGDYAAALQAWREGYSKLPDPDATLTLKHALASTLTGHAEHAAALLQTLPASLGADGTLRETVQAMADLIGPAPQRAIESVEAFLRTSHPLRSVIGDTVLKIAQFQLHRDPQSPWPHYLFALALETQDQPQLAAVGLRHFIDVCPDPEWRARAQKRLEGLPQP